MGRLGIKERRFLAEILYGFITRDYLRVAEVHYEAGYVPPTYPVENFAQALRAIGEPIHSRTADQISMAKLLTLLFEITALFDMIVANDVSPSTGIMGGDKNAIHIVTREGIDSWPTLDKDEVARRLIARLAKELTA